MSFTAVGTGSIPESQSLKISLIPCQAAYPALFFLAGAQSMTETGVGNEPSGTPFKGTHQNGWILSLRHSLILLPARPSPSISGNPAVRIFSIFHLPSFPPSSFPCQAAQSPQRQEHGQRILGRVQASGVQGRLVLAAGPKNISQGADPWKRLAGLKSEKRQTLKKTHKQETISRFLEACWTSVRNTPNLGKRSTKLRNQLQEARLETVRTRPKEL